MSEERGTRDERAGRDRSEGRDGRESRVGSLLAIGGNEDKRSDMEVLKRLIELPPGGTKHLEIIPTASTQARSVADEYIDVFRGLGVENIGVLDIRDRRDSEYQEYIERIQKADVVYMTGGDQLRLTSLIGGSPIATAFKERYLNGGIVAGTSAGAAAMSTTMIAGGDDGRMRKGSVRMAPGLGFIENCILDTHFLDRGRVGRLLEVVAANPGHVGLGVGEDTGALVRGGRWVEVVGSGVVVVVDGTSMASTNLPHIQPDAPIAVEGILVHTLAPGFQYDLKEKRYIQPRSEGNGEGGPERDEAARREEERDGRDRPHRDREDRPSRREKPVRA